MIKKIILLCALYYTSIIVSSCCSERLFIEFSFKNTEVKRIRNSTGNSPTYIISAINLKEESGFINGAIASIRGFNSANASPKCPEDVYVFKTVIIDLELTSNKDYSILFPAGTLLNNLVDIKLNDNGINLTESERYYPSEFSFMKNELGIVSLKNINDSVHLHDLYFKYEFNNGEIHRDTLFNQDLNWKEYN